jgi:hypothetical protein
MCVSFVRTWVEAVIRQHKRVREIQTANDRAWRNYERMEDWSPTEEELSRGFRLRWAEEHVLVWAAHQVEVWSARLAKERGEPAPTPDPVLKLVRNALEHLDEAEFVEDAAVPGERGNRSLRLLPDQQLQIALGGPKSFGLVDFEEIERRAAQTVKAIDDEVWAALDAYAQDWVMEMERDD